MSITRKKLSAPSWTATPVKRAISQLLSPEIAHYLEGRRNRFCHNMLKKGVPEEHLCVLYRRHFTTVKKYARKGQWEISQIKQPWCLLPSQVHQKIIELGGPFTRLSDYEQFIHQDLGLLEGHMRITPHQARMARFALKFPPLIRKEIEMDSAYAAKLLTGNALLLSSRGSCLQCGTVLNLSYSHFFVDELTNGPYCLECRDVPGMKLDLTCKVCLAVIPSWHLSPAERDICKFCENQSIYSDGPQ